MERRTFRTPLGDVAIWADAAVFQRRSPLVFAIRGAMPEPHDLEWLAETIEEIAFVHLPGFHSPPLAENSIEAFAQAFDRILDAWGRPVTVLGVSAGAVVAAGMRSSRITGKLLVEPFFSTAKLWALVELVRAALPEANDAYKAWCFDVLGVAATDVVDRNYRSLLRPERMVVIAGDEPLLPRRPMWTLPSLTDDDDQALLVQIGIRLVRAKGGHNIPETDRPAILAALADMRKDDEEPAITGVPRAAGTTPT